MGINLSKETQEKINLRKDIVINLVKTIGIGEQKAQVILVLDISISMKPLYASGLVQDVVERIVPLALQFDDNGQVDVLLFQNKAFEAPTVALSNLEGYVQREVMKFPFMGTSYEPVLQLVRKTHAKSAPKAGSGLFGGLFSKAGQPTTPTYVVFVTDGDNDDHSATERVIRDASSEGIFFQFVGIGREQFKFLDKLDNLSGRKVDNAGFFKADDIKKLSDQDLYQKLLKEFPTWLTEARNLNIIK
jgi:hypothetical protein